MKNSFAENLKKLRLENGFSQKNLAEKLEISVKTLSHWETGYSEPSIDFILKLATFFEVTTDYLLSD
ncbi:MAG: helix-turn-helix transcriptional regulator [Clostridiales bacterium]|nr:helix-turn-helix transcriptional regulator [Clostridiales bacterium]